MTRSRTGVAVVALAAIFASAGAVATAEPPAVHGHRAGGAPPGLVLTLTTDAMPKTGAATVRVLHSTFLPGYSSGWHMHPSPPFVYVVSGTPTWEYRDGRAPLTRRAGQAIMEPKNVVLRLRNRSSKPMHLVLFQVSKPGEPLLLPAH